MTTRTVAGALTYAGQQHNHIVMPPSLLAQGAHDWEGFCQAFVRSCYGIGSLFGSAWAQWNGADAADRHPGGSPDDAPVGAALCFKGSGPNGHIDLGAHPFPRGPSAAWSNDLVRHGGIDKVLRTDPTTHWGQRYLGWLSAVNDVDLPLHKPTDHARPKQTKKYAAIETAMRNLEASLTVAQRQHDATDVRALEAEITRLDRLHKKLRRH